MDIKLTDTTLRQFLDTNAPASKIAEVLTLCGPSVDRLNQEEGDYVYEIEVITNRVDSASAFGIAREAAAILPLFGIKAVLKNSPYDITAADMPERKSAKLPLTFEIQNHDLVKRASLVVLDNLSVKPSPQTIEHQLRLAGIRPLNNLIDVTNYLTLIYGQPVHIFDYDKIKGAKMILRESRKGEKITTLDNQSHTLQGGDIVIEDGDGRLIDLCGIMGGKLSEVDDNTKRAILFVQTYEPKRIRKTSLYTQERTIAAQIFEKQPDTRLVAPVLIEGVKMLQNNAGAKIAGESLDYYFVKPATKNIGLSLKWLNSLIGFKFDSDTVVAILKSLGFNSKKESADKLLVDVPTWRLHDINIEEDLAEEVARVYGYYRLESRLPVTAPLSAKTNPLLMWEYLAKNYLSDLGFSEIFNYSLVSDSLFRRADMEIEGSVRLENPLTPEFEYMRRSLIPSLLLNLENNQGKVALPLRLYELANIYLPTDDQLPEERSILVFTTQGVGYRQTKGYLEALLSKLHLPDVTYQPLDISEDDGHSHGCWQTNMTAEIYSGQNFLGIFGAVNPKVKNNFQLSGDIFMANLDFTIIASLANTNYSYIPISPYPDVVEDITIESDKPISSLIQLIKQAKLVNLVAYKSSLGNKHSFEVHFNDPKRNLNQKDVDAIKTQITASVKP